jgi:hypothetical protein
MLPNRFVVQLAVWSGLIIAGSTTHVRAGAPADELLRLTPKDATFCVLTQGLRGHVQEWQKSPFWQAFPDSRLGKSLIESAEFQRLKDLQQVFAKALGTPLPTIRDEMFGDAVLIAYQSGPPGKPEQEQGLILSWVRNPKVAQQFFDRLNEVQKQSGELKELQTTNYLGVSCNHRVKSQGADEFYFLHGNVLAFTSQEPMLRRALELNRDLPSIENKQPFLSEQFARLGMTGSVASIWINPRSFDAELTLRQEQAKDGEAAFLHTFQQYWQALDGFALGVSIDRQLELKLVFSTQFDKIPEPLRALHFGVTKPTTLWNAFPTEAIFATAGNIDFRDFAKVLAEFLTEDNRKSMQETLEQNLGGVVGKNVLPLLPKQLGPDWGICIMPPAVASSLTPDLLLALRVRSTDEENQIEQAVGDAMDALALLFRFNYNASHPEPVRQKVIRHDNVDIKCLVNDKGFPPGFQPAYTLKDGYLLVASSPTVIQNFHGNKAVAPAATINEVPLVRISFRQLDQYLEQRHGELAKLLEARNQVPAAEGDRQLQKLKMSLELLDSLELVNQSQKPGQLVLCLRIAFREPWKKEK